MRGHLEFFPHFHTVFEFKALKKVPGNLLVQCWVALEKRALDNFEVFSILVIHIGYI